MPPLSHSTKITSPECWASTFISTRILPLMPSYTPWEVRSTTNIQITTKTHLTPGHPAREREYSLSRILTIPSVLLYFGSCDDAKPSNASEYLSHTEALIDWQESLNSPLSCGTPEHHLRPQSHKPSYKSVWIVANIINKHTKANKIRRWGKSLKTYSFFPYLTQLYMFIFVK